MPSGVFIFGFLSLRNEQHSIIAMMAVILCVSDCVMLQADCSAVGKDASH